MLPRDLPGSLVALPPSLIETVAHEARGTRMDTVPEEVPVALAYNGISHAVMLASPADLEDFGLGFSLSEGILEQASELYDLELEVGGQGVLLQLHDNQPLHASTGGVHAAAWADAAGDLLLVREDVGRHNALDKLIGALAQARHDFHAGFVLVTSRASFEMVQKTAAVGIPMLAAVSAPTGYAIRVARDCGLTLAGFVRAGRHTIYAHPERVTS